MFPGCTGQLMLSDWPLVWNPSCPVKGSWGVSMKQDWGWGWSFGVFRTRWGEKNKVRAASGVSGFFYSSFLTCGRDSSLPDKAPADLQSHCRNSCLCASKCPYPRAQNRSPATFEALTTLPEGSSIQPDQTRRVTKSVFIFPSLFFLLLVITYISKSLTVTLSWDNESETERRGHSLIETQLYWYL